MKLKEINEDFITSKIAASFCAALSEDDKLSILTDSGLEIFHFKHNPKNKVGDVHYTRSFLYPLVNYPTENAKMNLEKYRELDRQDIFETLYDPILMPRLYFAKDMPVHISRSSWSPAGIIDNRECLVALLTNAGGVTLWKYEANSWVIRSDISNFIIIHLQESSQLQLDQDDEDYFRNFRNNCDRLTSTAIVWSKLYKIDTCTVTFLATIQRSGEIYIWKLTSDKTLENNLTIEMVTVFSTELDYVDNMYWLHINDELSLLIHSGMGGTIGYFYLQILKDLKIQFLKKAVLWAESDRLVASHITSITLEENRLCIVVSKGSYFLSFILNESGKLIGKAHLSLANISIAGLQHLDAGRFIVSTLTGAQFIVEISLDGNSPVLKSDSIACEIDFNRWAQYGLSASKNKAIFAMLISPCKPMVRRHGKVISKAVFLHFEDFDPMEALLSNKTQVLTHHWDCLELARVLAVKNKEIPANWPLALSDKMSTYEMKICLWSLVMEAEILDRTTEANHSEIMKKILSGHCQRYVKKLLSKHTEMSKLSNFELETLSYQYRFLIFTKKHIQDENIQALISDVDNKFRYVLPEFIKHCEWCGEELPEAICSKGHPRDWCCITLRDLEVHGNLTCPICASMAHPSLLPDEPICTFCDFYLNNNYLLDVKKPTQEHADEEEQTHSQSSEDPEGSLKKVKLDVEVGS